ncbi:PilN domain-containing protein [Legionella waltersii]|uniref:Fimbrial assembly protein (PilN) n=1 Tax=Legionella waltersii TaxID=66969 RepID=A0A0W1AMM2_9GAMM|nr:PilN domain-containing protein [Legionella waltersii]KTD82580.1 Fimbrial assembly protein (PilN) [Legionella waltersii]SNV02512.1 Fimbrial assembly protein (PilN) [Legionella waltersii]
MQSINFVNSLPKATSRLSAFWLGFILFCILVTLLIISFIIEGVYINAYRVEKGAETELQQAQADFANLQKTYPLLADDTPLVNKVVELDKNYQEKVHELEVLQHMIVRLGFSNYLESLARVIPSSLWLNEIVIHHDQNKVTLNGFTIDPDSITSLMRNLSKEEPFKKIEFTLFFVQALKNHSYAKFSISNSELGQKEIEEQQISDLIKIQPKE